MQLDADGRQLAESICRPFQEFQYERLGVAVSGGGDSTALLHLLSQSSIPLCAATVDHGLRPEAAREAEFVGEICAGLGVVHEVLNWETPETSGNLQARAREARYVLLAEWSKRNDLSAVALGHTADDISEGFLIRLARGSGLDGLAAMEPRFTRNGAVFHRPLLEVSRAELRGFLVRHALEWCEDPSNDDLAFDRVKARKLLTSLAPLGIETGKISQAASHLRDAKRILRRATVAAAKDCVTFDRGDALIVAATFEQIDPELQRRILAQLLRWVSGATYAPRADSLGQLLGVLRAQGKATLDGVLIISSNEKLRLTREENAVKETVCAVSGLWDERWRLQGEDAPGLTVQALGERGLQSCPDWRDTDLPRASLLASPSVWSGDRLVAAPLANFANGWQVELVRDEEDFFSATLTH